MQRLLEAKRLYWKQRSTVHWVKFGDENSELFQAMATHAFRRNYIATLISEDGTSISDHSLKAGALWISFKDRLGIPEFVSIHFELATLIQAVNLLDMDLPFSKEEIDFAVKSMPSDHPPRPDGFNGLFMKKCWYIISEDFYRLCEAFWNCNVDLECINGSYITLVPKKDNPLTVNDYMPISLLNYSLKLLTKLLVNRLQHVILDVVHENQYGFLKGRTIQDCLAWAFQFLHIYHHSKKEIVILKLDFEKASDKIEHQVILEMFRHKGFSAKWVKWIEMI